MYVVQDMLPKLSYFSLISRYVLKQELIIMCVCFQNIVFGLVAGPIAAVIPGFEISEQADIISLALLCAVWLAVNLTSIGIWSNKFRMRKQAAQEFVCAEPYTEEEVNTPQKTTEPNVKLVPLPGGKDGLAECYEECKKIAGV